MADVYRIWDGRNGAIGCLASVDGLPCYDPDWTMYSHDLAKAEEHLRAAWDGEVWENGFTFTLAYTAGYVEGKVACEILQQNLFTLNPKFKVNLQIVEWPTMLNDMVMGVLPMFVNGWIADYPDPHNFVFPFMHSKGAFSGWQKYNNPEVDELITQGISAIDPNVKKRNLR